MFDCSTHLCGCAALGNTGTLRGPAAAALGLALQRRGVAQTTHCTINLSTLPEWFRGRFPSVCSHHVLCWVEEEMWGWMEPSWCTDARQPGLEVRVWRAAAREKLPEEPRASRYQHTFRIITLWFWGSTLMIIVHFKFSVEFRLVITVIKFPVWKFCFDSVV